MSNNPNSGHDTALTSPVNWPRNVRERVRELVEVICSDLIEQSDYDKVPYKVREGVNNRASETVRRDGFFYLTKCDWWL
jgi:hypothetical protein